MSRKVVGPLTTTFTPPSGCSVFAASGGLSSTVLYWQGQSCSGGAPVDNPKCWPSITTATPSGALNGLGMFSPGLICPSGYYSACTAALNTNGSPSPLELGTSFKPMFPLTAGETAIGCCPNGMTCTSYGNGIQTCGSVMTEGKVPGGVGFCPESGKSFYATPDITIGISYSPNASNSTLVTLAEATLYAPLIQMVFKSTDISTLPSPTPPSTSIASELPTPTAAGSYNGAEAAGDPNAGGLSTGAKIGIGVGVPLAVILVAAIAAFIFFRRRRQNKINHQPISGAPFQGAHEKPADHEAMAGHHQQYQNAYGAAVTNPGAKWNTVAEAPNSHRNELDATPMQQPAELSAQSPAQSAAPGWR